MKCPSCEKELILQIATQVKAEQCHILTEITSVVTVQCDACKSVFQVPIKNKKVYSVKEE